VKKTPSKPTHHLSKYSENVPVDAYIHARTGMSNNAVAQTLGVNSTTFEAWLKRYPALAYALKRARGNMESKSAETFCAYVYRQLPAHLKELWDQISMWHEHESGLERIEAILGEQSTRVRQSLWVHAMIEANFNASEACRMVGISYGTLRKWVDNDPDFPALVDEIQQHKKNFFEGGLVNLVAKGNVLATIFANKTQNKDRGYAEKITVGGTVNHNHTGTVTVNHVPLSKLNLPLETRVQIREAMRQLKRTEAPDTNLPDEPAQRVALEAVAPEEAEDES